MATLGRSHVILAAVLGAVVTAVAYWNAAVPTGILVDVLVVAVLTGAASAIAGIARPGRFRRVIWIGCGALVLAAAAAIAWMPPWILLVALGFAVSLFGQRPSARWAPVRALGLMVLGAMLNVYALGALATYTPFNADVADYRALDLRVHSMMAGVPPRDVWVVDLQGGGEGRGIRDLVGLPAGAPGSHLDSALPGVLVASRLGVGRILGWDTVAAADPAESYITRLTPADRARCGGPCDGERSGPFGMRTLYTFEREMAREVQNRTVHAVLSMALVPAGRGYRLYIGVYVRRANWFTPFYMKTIDPFRRLVLYPVGLRELQRRWQSRWGSVAGPGK